MGRRGEGGLTPREEDYLEALLIIEEEGGGRPARLRDVSRLLGVRMPSAVQMLRSLSQRGLVSYERYGWIELTPEGRRIARDVYRRHVVLKRFLSEFLGVEEEEAAREACSMEHYLDEDTLNRFIRFLEFFEACSEVEPLWLLGFRRFSEEGRLPWFCGKPPEEKLAGLEIVPMNRLGEGDRAVVVEVGDPSLLDLVAPGWVIRVVEVGDGFLRVEVGGERREVPAEAAGLVRVAVVASG